MILLLCYFSACQGGWFCVIELNRSIGRPAFHRGWRQTGRPREGRPHFKHSLLTYSKTLMAPKSGDPGCDHEGDFVHGQPPQHLSGSGKGGYTDRQGGPSVLGGDWGGRALHVYIQTRHVYVVALFAISGLVIDRACRRYVNMLPVISCILSWLIYTWVAADE